MTLYIIFGIALFSFLILTMLYISRRNTIIRNQLQTIQYSEKIRNDLNTQLNNTYQEKSQLQQKVENLLLDNGKFDVGLVVIQKWTTNSVNHNQPSCISLRRDHIS